MVNMQIFIERFHPQGTLVLRKGCPEPLQKFTGHLSRLEVALCNIVLGQPPQRPTIQVPGAWGGKEKTLGVGSAIHSSPVVDQDAKNSALIAGLKTKSFEIEKSDLQSAEENSLEQSCELRERFTGVKSRLGPAGI